MRRALAAALAATAARGDVTLTTYASTAFAPAATASTATVPAVGGGGAPAPFTSSRFTGTLTVPALQEMNFSVTADGPALLYIDDHLLIDGFSRGNDAFMAYAFKALSVPFRLELIHGAAPTPPALFWAGNFTPRAPVPAAALSPAAAPAVAARQALKDRMLAPRVQWQTYSNPTMGAHVRMPQAVALDATLADLATNATLGDIIVFRQASPAITFVGAHSYNGSDFTQVQLDAWGGRACTIVLRTTTSADGADLAFLATSNGTGCATLALLVRPEMLWGRAGTFSRDASGALRAATPGFPDTLAWPLGAAPVPFAKAGALDWALPLGGGAAGFTTGAAPRAVADVAADIDAAAARQDAALQKWDARGLTSVYVPQASCIAWNTIYTPYEGVVTPVSRGWDFGAGYVIFDWDNLFLAYMASIEEESLDISFSNLIQIALARTQDGFVPNFASSFHVSYDRTEPQIGAYVTLQIYKKWGAARAGWLVDTVLDALLEWQDWTWRKRRGEGSLATADGHADLIVLGSDPNAAPGGTVGGANTLQAARYESGLDNSPMYDGNDACDAAAGPVCFDKNGTHHMTLYDVGMSGLFLSDTAALLELAAARGRADVLPQLQARYDRVAAATAAHLWAPGAGPAGAFANVLYNGSFYARLSPTSFFPLISGAATPAQAAATAALAASPLGFCLDTGYTPDASAAALVQWFGGGHDNAPCVTDACLRDTVNAKYRFIRVEGVPLLPAAGAAPGRVPLNLWYSAARGDYAMTNSSAPPEPSGYAFVRQEGWCFDAPPSSAAAGRTWNTTRLTSWFSAARKDYQVCGTANCLADVAKGYVFTGDLCYAFAGETAADLPCKFGGNSIVRGDEAFWDNNYWRGRIWGPHLQLIYWALAHPSYRDMPAVAAARTALVAQGRRLVEQEWSLFRQVTENYNGVIGVGEDVGNADPFYHWGALAGFLSFLEAGAY